MGLKSKSLLPFVQKPDCKHSFGCLEHLIRKLAYNTGLYFIAKYLFEAVAPNEWTVSELVSVASSKRNLKLTEGKQSAISYAVQALLILGFSLYSVSRCFFQLKRTSNNE